MMKNKINILIVCCIICFQVKGQIGLNTQYPQQLFHIDAKSDNGNTSSPTNTTDDVVITSAGNVGIGTINPQAKLDIYGKLRINDGSQKQGYILKSDANGVATWDAWSTPTKIDMGNLDPNGKTIAVNTTNNIKPMYVGGSISLAPGKSLIRASFYCTFSTTIAAGEYIQLRYEWSTSTTSLVRPQYLNPIGVGFVTATGIYPNSAAATTGLWVINNPNTTDLTLYLFAEVNASQNTLSKGYLVNGCGGSGWYENVVVINKINN